LTPSRRLALRCENPTCGAVDPELGDGDAVERDLPDELGRGQGSATGESQQAGREGCGPGGDFGLELVDALGQSGEALDLLESQGSNQAILAVQLVLERQQRLLSVEAVALVVTSGCELMEVPAKPVLNSCALSHQVFAVSHEEAHLTTGTVRGNTKREAIRALRRRISDEVFRRMCLDETAAAGRQRRAA
jgi:hypothetical protein